jgi:hypothetical protein
LQSGLVAKLLRRDDPGTGPSPSLSCLHCARRRRGVKESQPKQGRDLSSLAPLRALWARTPVSAWARRAVGECVNVLSESRMRAICMSGSCSTTRSVALPTRRRPGPRKPTGSGATAKLQHISRIGTCDHAEPCVSSQCAMMMVRGSAHWDGDDGRDAVADLWPFATRSQGSSHG